MNYGNCISSSVTTDTCYCPSPPPPSPPSSHFSSSPSSHLSPNFFPPPSPPPHCYLDELNDLSMYNNRLQEMHDHVRTENGGLRTEMQRMHDRIVLLESHNDAFTNHARTMNDVVASLTRQNEMLHLEIIELCRNMRHSAHQPQPPLPPLRPQPPQPQSQPPQPPRLQSQPPQPPRPQSQPQQPPRRLKPRPL